MYSKDHAVSCSHLTLTGIIHLSKMCSKICVAYLSKLLSPFHHGTNNNVSKNNVTSLVCAVALWKQPLTSHHFFQYEHDTKMSLNIQVSMNQWHSEGFYSSSSFTFLLPIPPFTIFSEANVGAAATALCASMWLLSWSSQESVSDQHPFFFLYRAERKYCFQEN